MCISVNVQFNLTLNLTLKYIAIVIDSLTKLLLPVIADEKIGIYSDSVQESPKRHQTRLCEWISQKATRNNFP